MEKRVLVINRIGTLRRLTVNVLNSLDYYSVVEVSSTEIANRIIEESGPFPLILFELSVAGPTSSDIEFSKYLQTLKEQTVIFTSPNADKRLVLKCLRMGADYFVVKSLNMESFAARLEKALEKLGLHNDNPVFA